MKKIVAAICLILSIVGPAAGANHAYTQESLNVMGARETIDWTKRPVKVEIIVNEDTTLKAVPLLQSQGVLNPDISQTFINAYPHSVCIVFAQMASVMNIMDAYSNTSIDKADFSIFLEVTNDYGERIKKPVFTFSFDRKTYNRIHWDNFQMSKLPKVGLRFRYTPWATANYFGDGE